jgi:hypothetical protein
MHEIGLGPTLTPFDAVETPTTHAQNPRITTPRVVSTLQDETLVFQSETFQHESTPLVRLVRERPCPRFARKVLAAVSAEVSGWCEVDVVVRTGVPSLEISRSRRSWGATPMDVGHPRGAEPLAV